LNETYEAPQATEIDSDQTVATCAMAVQTDVPR
jgi:hypothetical protein